MKKLPVNTVPTDDGFQSIVICAVRYACGRNSYMPGLVQDWIIGNCGGKLSVNTLSVIQRDINEQIEMTARANINHGSKQLYEHDLMLKLRDWCENELRRFKI